MKIKKFIFSFIGLCLLVIILTSFIGLSNLRNISEPFTPEESYDAIEVNTQYSSGSGIQFTSTYNTEGQRSTFPLSISKKGTEKIYFGQIHSHTTLSDGKGEVEEAYIYARDVAKLDFFAVTDHSESFYHALPNDIDPADIDLNTHNIVCPHWQRGLAAAASAYREDSFISFFGYEISWWQQGVNHINTFNTGGFVSTYINAFYNKADFEGIQNYYDLLKRTPDSISMFNHPGLDMEGFIYGNFNDFAYYDPELDQMITLIEVGNGEGPLDSYYWRMYDQYILALDKGWKLAPVNNPDTHEGEWGTSNSIRTAIWTDDLSLEGVYRAFREKRVYATEVADLEIVYEVNGHPLGSTIDKVPGIAKFSADIVNPTSDNIIKSVAIVTNGGVRILENTPMTQNYHFKETLENPNPGYYFLWVDIDTPEGDRIAVTAPVWLG